ncbi:hypothetical protein L9F63_012413, partial [Diploptera punctata]
TCSSSYNIQRKTLQSQGNIDHILYDHKELTKKGNPHSLLGTVYAYHLKFEIYSLKIAQINTKAKESRAAGSVLSEKQHFSNMSRYSHTLTQGGDLKSSTPPEIEPGKIPHKVNNEIFRLKRPTANLKNHN